MNTNKVYITGAACISAQHTFENDEWSGDVASQNRQFFCIEPDYKNYIEPKNIRRVSRIQKLGIATAMRCLQKAKIEMPDAIVVGTGWGCIDSTYQFLDRLYNLQGLPVNPSSFIHSTHNTIATQIALHLQCRNYNNTITDNRLALELSLDDALLHMSDTGAQDVLLGAVDELTPQLTNIITFVRRPHDPILLGEGCGFFMLSQQKSNNAIELKHMAVGVASYIESTLEEIVSRFAVKQIFTPHKKCNDVFTGFSGVIVNYENMCGSYPTSSAFGLYMAMRSVLKNSDANEYEKNEYVQNILLYNKSGNGMSAVMVIGKPNNEE